MGTCIIITTIVTIIMVRSLRGNEMAAVGCRAAQDGAWAAVDVVVVRGLYGAHESNIIRDFFIFLPLSHVRLPERLHATQPATTDGTNGLVVMNNVAPVCAWPRSHMICLVHVLVGTLNFAIPAQSPSPAGRFLLQF